jgi:hypothetical protein
MRQGWIPLLNWKENTRQGEPPEQMSAFIGAMFGLGYRSKRQVQCMYKPKSRKQMTPMRAVKGLPPFHKSCYREVLDTSIRTAERSRCSARPLTEMGGKKKWARRIDNAVEDLGNKPLRLRLDP